MTQRIVMLQALSAMPRQLADCLAKKQETAFQRQPAPEAWSALETLGHLVYVEEHSLKRLKLLVAEEHPKLPSIPPQVIPQVETYSAADLLRRFQVARAATLAFLKQLTPEEWQRTAAHETRGTTDLHFLVQYLVDHDRQHLQQMEQLLQLQIEK